MSSLNVVILIGLALLNAVGLGLLVLSFRSSSRRAGAAAETPAETPAATPPEPVARPSAGLEFLEALASAPAPVIALHPRGEARLAEDLARWKSRRMLPAPSAGTEPAAAPVPATKRPRVRAKRAPAAAETVAATPAAEKKEKKAETTGKKEPKRTTGGATRKSVPRSGRVRPGAAAKKIPPPSIVVVRDEIQNEVLRELSPWAPQSLLDAIGTDEIGKSRQALMAFLESCRKAGAALPARAVSAEEKLRLLGEALHIVLRSESADDSTPARQETVS